VGRPVVRALLARKRTVVALGRSVDARAHLEALGARPVAGDVCDEDSLVAGMRGCGVVFHVAGANAFCLADPGRLYDVNVSGSRAVVRAAQRVGIGRVVYTSSAAVIGERAGMVGREDTPHRGWFLSHYERSKFEAELAVLSAASAGATEVVCVNPSSVQGPGRAGGTARLIRLYLDGRLPVFIDSMISLVDVDDCARGHLAAEERGRPGERYLLSGATLSAREALALIAEASGLETRAYAIPGWTAQAGAAVIEALGRVTRRAPPVCRELVRTLRHGHRYDGSRAARELGIDYVAVDETLRRTVWWLAREGLVRRPLPRVG
jgi:dihydroflavonol-4-reductase